jgi:pimeloyl-ACP methyl ester carboxylesterase
MDNSSTAPDILTRDDGATIAYHHTRGKAPGVVFLTGFKSDMTGGKALAVEALCKRLGHAFLRFDYYGHGQSSGAFEGGTIGRWADDAITVIDSLTDGPQVLVGSSMGGWIMLLVARARSERIAGLVGIAAAPDFTEDLIPQALSDEQRDQLSRDGYVDIPNCYTDEEPYRICKLLLDEGQNNLLLRDPIAINAPVRLIHGMCDEDVPWETGLKILDKLESDDVEITYVKAGTHRLSEDHDLKRLERTLQALLEDL